MCQLWTVGSRKTITVTIGTSTGSAIVASAKANDITPAEAVQNMQKMAEQQGYVPGGRIRAHLREPLRRHCIALRDPLPPRRC